MPEISPNNYYVVHGWMITELGLKGVELALYAIIYGFSQDGEGVYSGSAQYLCAFCGGVSKPTVLNALKRLTESGLLAKETEDRNGVKFCRYKALPPVKNFYTPDKKILPPPDKNFLPNKERIDKEVNKEDISYVDRFEKLWAIYPRKEGKKKALEAYIRAAKKGTADADIAQGIERYSAHIRAQKIEPRYIKMGSTFFGGECWNDTYGATTARKIDNDPLDGIW